MERKRRKRGGEKKGRGERERKKEREREKERKRERESGGVDMLPPTYGSLPLLHMCKCTLDVSFTSVL
jgi:hypothetical protein